MELNDSNGYLEKFESLYKFERAKKMMNGQEKDDMAEKITQQEEQISGLMRKKTKLSK